MNIARTETVTREFLNQELYAHRCPLAPLPPNPLVSVLLINYNYAKFLPEALESLLAQTYSNWEAILVDDGSQDDSREIMSRYAAQDRRFKCVFKKNEGVPSALNDAYSHARGDIIALVDSDDAYLPGKLEWCVEAFWENPDCGTAVHVLNMVDARGEFMRTWPDVAMKRGWLVPEILEDGGRATEPPASGLAFRAELAKIIFPIPLSFRRGADSYLACVALLCTSYCASEEAQAIYRQHGANITSIYSRRWPDRVLISRFLDDMKRTEQAQLNYIADRLHVDASQALCVEDAWGYKIGVITYYVLHGRLPENIEVDMPRLLKGIPSPGLRAIFSFLLRYPRFLTLPFLYLWIGEYPGKRLLYPLVRLFRLRRGR